MEFKVPQKQLFKIGEVCEMMEVEPHTLRFWEKEFEDFNPQKNPMNQRVYRTRDIEICFLIKKLLYQEGYTIEGARRQLKREIAKLDRDGNGFPQEEVLDGLRKILEELKEILTILKD